jgi:N6-adenosine-specific RNA methylase IME4
MDLRAINEIIVGDRHRKQAGDIAALAQNIDEIGLLHPVVIDPAGHLIAGARRLMAFQHLGCTTIPRTTNHHMREAFGVLDAWGFEQKTILTWAKDKMGMGDWLRGKTEHCLLAVRGKPVVELKNQTTLLHVASSQFILSAIRSPICDLPKRSPRPNLFRFSETLNQSNAAWRKSTKRRTNHHMRGAFGVLDAWGFEQKTILTWAKDKMGMGDCHGGSATMTR